jgi:signal transduction histidine kinase
VAALSQVTSELTHQVKNRLQAMMVHVAVLKELLGAAPPEVRRSLDVLEGEINRADIGVNRLARAARPVEISMRPLELNPLLGEITASLSDDWHGKGISLLFEPDDSRLSVLGDQELLRRAFTEILVDAADAVREGGAVTVRTVREGSRAAVVVSAEPSGPGADLDARAGAAADRAMLPPLVRRVAEIHDGRVEIANADRSRLRVSFWLPLGQAVTST